MTIEVDEKGYVAQFQWSDCYLGINCKGSLVGPIFKNGNFEGHVANKVVVKVAISMVWGKTVECGVSSIIFSC